MYELTYRLIDYEILIFFEVYFGKINFIINVNFVFVVRFLKYFMLVFVIVVLYLRCDYVDFIGFKYVYILV